MSELETPSADRANSESEIADSNLSSKINDTLLDLPEAKRETILRVLREEVTQFAFKGPFPPPQMLDDYERHYPGFLKELMDRALLAQAHERDMERAASLEPFKYAQRGQIFGFLIVICAFGVTALGIVCHEPWVAGIASTAGMAPIVGHFLRNPPNFSSQKSPDDGPKPTKAARTSTRRNSSQKPRVS